MKEKRAPALILGLLYLCFVGYLVLSTSQLPAHVASHFDGNGRPNGWMDRTSYMLFIAVFGTCFPLVVPGICYSSRFLSDRFQNIPNRDYWLASERRAETMEYLFRNSLWLASMEMSFMIAVHVSVVYANGSERVHLPPVLIVGMLGCFVVGVAGWVTSMFLHFKRVP